MSNPPESQETFDPICFSHLRWSFVFKRPQHLPRGPRALLHAASERLLYAEVELGPVEPWPERRRAIEQ